MFLGEKNAVYIQKVYCKCTQKYTVEKKWSSLFALTWPNFILFLPFLIFGVAKEPGSGPGEMVIGQFGVFLSDEQRPEETFGCLLIILNGDLESSWKTLAVYVSPQIKTNLVLKSPFKNYNDLKQRSAYVFLQAAPSAQT